MAGEAGSGVASATLHEEEEIGARGDTTLGGRRCRAGTTGRWWWWWWWTTHALLGELTRRRFVVWPCYVVGGTTGTTVHGRHAALQRDD